MRRAFLVLVPFLIAASASVVHAGPWYVRSDFYCPDSTYDPGIGTCWGWDGGCELFDDGLHGDGAAGDGVFGADVVCTEAAGRHEFKIALNDWTEAYPTSPINSLANAVLYTRGPGDVVHVRFDTNFSFNGWVPPWNSVSTDRPYPDGTTLEVIGGGPEFADWTQGVQMRHVGQRWQQVITIHTPGMHEYKIRVAGTWTVVAFGYDYDNTSGRNAVIQTELPETDVLFQYDETTGQVRAIDLGQVPTTKTSWGQVKARYR